MSAFQPHPQASRKVANPRQQNPHSSRTHTVMTTTTATATHAVRQQNRPQQQRLRRKKLVFGWIQDVSGSMSGNRIEASLQGFDHMFEEVCQPTDYLGVVTYNGDLNTLHLPMQVQKIDASRDKAGIRKGLQGNTAYDRMYDAVGSSIRGLQAMAKDERYSAVTDDAVYQLLLLTDGGDNYSSEFTLATLTELVAHPGLPNFHLVVVAVSMSERDKQKLRGLCAPVHATFLDVKNFSDLQHTLHEVGEVVQQRLVFTTTTVTQTRTVMQGRSTGGTGSVQTITEGLAATRLHSLPYQPVTRTLAQKQPQKQKQNRTPRLVTNGANICQHFLTGTCVFGKKC